MKKLRIKITFEEPVLGTSPRNEEIFMDYVASKAPTVKTMEEEIEAMDVVAVAEKSMTVFPRNADGMPILWDYQVKGFFKDSCQMLAKLGGAGKDKKPVNESSKLKAYRKVIDGLIFVFPRQIVLNYPGEIGICQRPLRAQTMQGERVALTGSEELPAGTTAELEIMCMDDAHEAAVREWLDYGALRGIGQWRNSGKGRFRWEELK